MIGKIRKKIDNYKIEIWDICEDHLKQYAQIVDSRMDIIYNMQKLVFQTKADQVTSSANQTDLRVHSSPWDYSTTNLSEPFYERPLC